MTFNYSHLNIGFFRDVSSCSCSQCEMVWKGSYSVQGSDAVMRRQQETDIDARTNTSKILLLYCNIVIIHHLEYEDYSFTSFSALHCTK